MTINVAIRLTLASVLAMTVASALSLQNPWWAAMAVWMVGQPTRGVLFERALAQLLGTVLGAAAGAILVLAWPGNPAASVTGLVVWIAICGGLANAMRHQRAYGAALCGLTAAVIVSLTLGSNIDPQTFAVARALDNVIGVSASILIAFLLGSNASGLLITERARQATSDAFVLMAEALSESGARSFKRERDFLSSLAALEASAEDVVAGSVKGRRKLKEANTLFAHLLDLIVMARAIRARERAMLAPGHADMVILSERFQEAVRDLASGRGLDLQGVYAASQRLERVDPVLSPILREMRVYLSRATEGYQRVMATACLPASGGAAWHPDFAGMRIAMLRGALAVSLSGGIWLLVGWEPLRYLMLGAGIFTVLFSAVDEPATLVRQIFIGGLVAAVAAFVWRVAVLPEVSNGWLSLALAAPLVFGASLLQARQRTALVGLAFNMLFAVLARPVDMSPGSPIVLIGIEAMLLAGIALSYAFYRWLLPMDSKRRRKHLKASIRSGVAAISARASTPLAERHLARLRYLVFSLTVRSRGQVREVEDALAALSLGHVLLRLGEMSAAAPSIAGSNQIIQATLRLMSTPVHDPVQAATLVSGYVSELDSEGTSHQPEPRRLSRMRWLLELAAHDLRGHPSIFAVKKPDTLLPEFSPAPTSLK